MSQPPKNKKKIVATKKKIVATGTKKKLSPTSSKALSRAKAAVATKEMLFGKENFKWMLIGLGLIILGMFLMSGGSMPDANTWDESLIYSHRRITLAPMVIIAGLAVEVYAIFK